MGSNSTQEGAQRVREFGPRRGFRTRDWFVEVWVYRSFVADQIRRRIRTRYSRSVLGWGWSLISPLATLLIYTLVFGTILQGSRHIPEHPSGLTSFGHYLFSALVVWFVFNQVSTSAIGDFALSLTLRKRLYFPPVAPILASVASGLVGSAVEVLVLVLAYVAVGAIGWTFLGLIVLMPLVALFALGIGLCLAPLNARFRDVGHLYQVLLRLLFFTTPIIYSIEIVPEEYAGLPMKRLLELNPLGWMTDAARLLTFEQRWPSSGHWASVVLVSLATVSVGWLVFHRLADDVTEGF